MTNIILFQFESNAIRFVGTAENPEWIAADVCNALGLENVSQALATLGQNEKGIIEVNTLGGAQQHLTVNEPGLYRLIFKSRKAAARRMSDWVFSEVLPSIRKTGSYSLAPQPETLKIVEAVEVAEGVDKIQNILSKSNPRLAQLLIDIGVNHFVESNQPKSIAAAEFPDDRWYSLVSIAEKMEVKTNPSTRVMLGQFIASKGFDRVKEDRLCNGEMRPIWCYRDNEETRAAIKEWAEAQV